MESAEGRTGPRGKTDRQLLAEYAVAGSAEAFAEIVRRHTDAVYATCLRVLGEADAAEDAAQAAFLSLARQGRRAATIRRLPAWLHAVGTRAALNLLESERRRARHEKEAAQMRATAHSHRSASWDEVRPALDAELAALNPAQREVLVMRCLWGRSEAQTAAELGWGRSRVSVTLCRALESLRERLVRRGVAVPAAALAGLLAANATAPAPAGLAAAIQAACLGRAAVSGPALNATEGVMRAMLLAKVKMVAAVTGAVVAFAAGGVALAMQLAAGERPGVPAAAPVAAAADAGPGSVVLDPSSLWRSFSVSRPSYVRTAAGKLEARNVDWYWGGISSKPVPQATPSPLPPAGWTGPEFDDGLWPRVRLPQPVLTVSGANPRPFYMPYATAMVVVRGKFEVKDPARVQGCSLALSYWGGAVAYVNGKEVARGHAPGGDFGPETVAEDYPQEAFTTPEGKAMRVGDPKNRDRLALRDRKLEMKIPAELLRKGVNVVAIEVRQAPVPEVIAKGVGQGEGGGGCGWPPIGLLDAQLTVSPPGAATAGLPRPGGIQVWNCAPYETITAFDCGDPAEPLRPIRVQAARNGIFSGRLAVSSGQAIKNLKVTVADLAAAGGGSSIPASAVRVRYAEPAVPEKSFAPPHRFDGLVEAIPTEIPVIKAGVPREGFFGAPIDRKNLAAGAVASIWLTVRVPKDAKPGKYETVVTVSAEGLAAVKAPLEVTVSDWTVPDPKDFRIQNFGYLSDDAVALHYGVPRWSDRHFELMAKSFALMAEVNSRQVFANLCINFYGGNKGGADSSNAESLIRWIKQPDPSAGSGQAVYKYDFTVFDKYLDMVSKVVGKPLPLRLNCWGEVAKKDGKLVHNGVSTVSGFDPATGKVEPIGQPVPGTEESLAFWKPVLDEVRKKVEARGWWEVTAMGHNSYCYSPVPEVVSVYAKIWPDGVWSYTAHNGTLGGRLAGTDKSVTTLVRYADTVWGAGRLTARGYGALLKPRPGFWCFTYRGCFRDDSPLTDLRRIAEDEAMMGHDGVSDFGVDLFPVKAANGRYYRIGNGRGTGGPGCSTMAVLAPGPDGPVATERFEMLREGVELAEAILFIQRAIEEKKISGDLETKANRYLDERGEAFLKGWYGVRYLQAEHDEKLLGLAGEVARAAR